MASEERIFEHSGHEAASEAPRAFIRVDLDCRLPKAVLEPCLLSFLDGSRRINRRRGWCSAFQMPTLKLLLFLLRLLLRIDRRHLHRGLDDLEWL